MVILIRALILCLILLPVNLWAACPGTPADCYTVTPCANGEDGTCRTAIDCTSDAIQATINASTGTGTGLAANGASFNGDGAYVPACSDTTWTSTSQLAWTNKNITLIGAGIDSTNIIPKQNFVTVTVTNPDRAQFRISGFTLSSNNTDQPTGSYIKIQAQALTSVSSGWRIDNIKTSTTLARSSIYIEGPTYGLVDSCQFSASKKFIEINARNTVNDTDSILGTYERSLTLGMGTANAVYVENCTAANTTNSTANVITEIDGGGGSLVLRYNNLTGGALYTHWTRGSALGPRKLELYNNSIATGSYTQTVYGRLSGGTGVVYNNAWTGFGATRVIYLDEYRGYSESSEKLLDCQGSRTWDMNTEVSGWPCIGQIGRGQSTRASENTYTQEWYPMLGWNNTYEGGSVSFNVNVNYADYVKPYGTNHANGQWDYYDASSLTDANEKLTAASLANYTAYTCPHPLTGLAEGCTSGTPGIAGYGTATGTYDAATSVGSNTTITPTSATITDNVASIFAITWDAGYRPYVSGCGGTYDYTHTYSTGGSQSENCTITSTAISQPSIRTTTSPTIKTSGATVFAQ